MAMAIHSSSDLCDAVWPPGFRFHPTDEELILYYLKRKICRRRVKLDIIREIDVYKHEPEELPGLSLLKNGDRLWFFLSPRDKKYQNGSRSNRATRHGYWKATGKDRTVTCSSRNVGVKKTLVFYRGRAPSGERTDWVMHEYALVEEELKRCQNAQDYYAIYKVFKKSGPGPKNGEQYGALFREEDWVGDDFPGTTRDSGQTNHCQQVENVLSGDSCRNVQVDPVLIDIRNVQVDPLLNDTDENMNHVLAKPAPQPVDVYDFEQALFQFVGDEEANSRIVSSSFAEVTHHEPCITHPVDTKQNGLEASVDAMHTSTSGLQMWEAPEVTFTPNTFDLQAHVTEGAYVEMDDLLGPETIEGINNLSSELTDDRLPKGSQWTEDNGLCEFDLFFDSAAFLGDLAPTDNGFPAGPCNQVGFQMQPYPDYVNARGSEIWSSDLNTSLSTTSPNQGPAPLSTSGDVYTEISGSIDTEFNQNHSSTGKEVEEAQPWYSSTLWSFVESIPAAPASAAETVLGSKAFQRVSSFSRVRINGKSMAAASCVSRTRSGSGSRIKGFYFFSFLAAVFAVFCVFVSSYGSVFWKLHRGMNL